jgi:hypothetical protein
MNVDRLLTRHFKISGASPTKNKGDLINYDIQYRMGRDRES